MLMGDYQTLSVQSKALQYLQGTSVLMFDYPANFAELGNESFIKYMNLLNN